MSWIAFSSYEFIVFWFYNFIRVLKSARLTLCIPLHRGERRKRKREKEKNRERERGGRGGDERGKIYTGEWCCTSELCVHFRRCMQRDGIWWTETTETNEEKRHNKMNIMTVRWGNNFSIEAPIISFSFCILASCTNWRDTQRAKSLILNRIKSGVLAEM